MITINEILEKSKPIREKFSKRNNKFEIKIDNIISKELDYYDFIHKKLPCRIIRHYGNLNGYVGVPKGHILFEKKYSNLDINVHGGLTYGDFQIIEGVSYNDYFYFGFDTTHNGDIFLTTLEKSVMIVGSTYKDYNYVKNEILNLAEQLYNFDPIFMRKNTINKLFKHNLYK